MTYQEIQIGKLFLDIIRDFYKKHPELKEKADEKGGSQWQEND